MKRIVALGFLIAGISPISLASSTVVNTNEKPLINLVQSAKVASLNSACSKLSSSTSCFSQPLVEREIQSDFWLQKIADSWLLNTPFLGCSQRSITRENSIEQLSAYQDSKVSFSQPNQASRSSKTGNVLPSLSKLANQKCVFSWQKQLDHQIISGESTNIGSNYAKKPQDYLPLPKFPQLSRSSLIVSFPGENSSFAPNINKLVNPAPETERIASGFGWRKRPYSNQLQFHQGIDYGAPYGSPVVAAGNGIVTRIVSGCADFGNFFCGGQLGNWIEVDHGNGTIGTYGHLKSSSITVKEGMKVWKNQRIAQVGSSGWSTGAHLDFRLKINGKHEDPAKYVTALNLGQMKATKQLTPN